MDKFLKEVAAKLIGEFGHDLSSHRLVFPNRRSSLFFARYLASMSDRPVWAPEMITINDLLSSHSGLKKAEPLQLVFELYSVFREMDEGWGSFDEFYFWGEMLINDFDDIDKYLVDAADLFSNLADLKEIDDKFGGFDPEVIDIIRKFWVNFDFSRMTTEKADFISVWGVLGQVYTRFRERLKERGIGYDGMIFRELVEKRASGYDWTDSKSLYHFIGFNALNRCEQEILDDLKKRERATFYWDYDEMYVRHESHEAGFFLRDNIRRYGPDNLGDEGRDSLLNLSLADKDWQVINAPSDVAQAKMLPAIISDMKPSAGEPDNTAIVLADENMLTPVLNSIPSGYEEINITMGYPLYHTPVYSLVHHLVRLQKNIRKERGRPVFYHTDVLNLLKHHYLNIRSDEENRKAASRIRELNMIRVPAEELSGDNIQKMVFRDVSGTDQLNNYIREVLMSVMETLKSEDNEDQVNSRITLQMEYIYSLVTSLNQLEDIISSSPVQIGIEIYGRIIDKIMRKIMVPFAGEPLRGLQVMGILETRLLDFDNLIILSANEGVLPKGSAQNSYIPYNLRLAFGLPTVKHQDSIFAYYFYRLLQRARKVRFIYNSSSSGMRSGEMSRFILQLKYSQRLKPEFIDSRFVIAPSKRFNDTIARDARVNEILLGRFAAGGRGGGLSPSAINTWLNCSMRFYYRYIADLKESGEITAEVDSPVFGNILHAAMKMIYTPYRGEQLSKSQITAIYKNGEYIEEVVRKAFGSVFLHDSKADISGRNIIVVSILVKMVKQIMQVDSMVAPLTIIALEKEYSMEIPVITGGREINVLVRGTIDRVDSVSGTLRILDYKSGNDSLEIRSFAEICMQDSKERNSAAFQTLVYCELYQRTEEGAALRPALYPVRQIFGDNFSDHFVVNRGDHEGEIDNYSNVRDDFYSGLSRVITEIMDRDVKFRMTDHLIKCSYCPYAAICEREDLK